MGGVPQGSIIRPLTISSLCYRKHFKENAADTQIVAGNKYVSFNY